MCSTCILIAIVWLLSLLYVEIYIISCAFFLRLYLTFFSSYLSLSSILFCSILLDYPVLHRGSAYISLGIAWSWYRAHCTYIIIIVSYIIHSTHSRTCTHTVQLLIIFWVFSRWLHNFSKRILLIVVSFATFVFLRYTKVELKCWRV